MKIRWAVPALAGILAAMTACGDDTPDEGVLAQAGGYVLTVDEAVELLVDEENLPAQTQVVQAVADLWIDYTLLAAAVAADSTFPDLDLELIVRQQLDDQMIFQLRDSVMQVDTAITDEELRDIYASQAPGAQLEASHILLGFPQEASQAERDSVTALAQAIRGRALAGESFSALAREFSQDRGSAAQGGSLGTFGRNEMVRPFEEAVFALEVGAISDVVETPFGLHIIRLDDRRIPELTEVGPQFRRQVQNQRVVEAESTFVANLEARAALEIQEGAVDIVKDLAEEPETRLAGRARRRALVRYDGGQLTVGEFQAFVQSRPAQYRGQVAAGTDEQLEGLLKSLVQRELLVAEARAAGLEPPQEDVDSMVATARAQLRAAASQIGILRLDRAPGEPLEPAVSRAVFSAMQGILTGAKDVIPLGQIAFQLRQGEMTSVASEGIGQTMLRIGEIRAGRSPAPFEEAPDSTAVADSTSG